MKERTPAGVIAALTAVLVLLAPHAGAQPATYPTKAIRLIVASGAGLDFVARQVAGPMSEAVGQTVVVDNRAGASGSIAAELAAQAAPDGYTVMFLSASLVVYGIVSKTRYDLYRDFAPVTQAAAAPYILTVYPGLPATTVKELIAYAKSVPTKLNYSSTGNASLAHLATELFRISTGIELVHVPYKGVGAALPDMLAGRIHMSFLSMGSVYSQVRVGKLKPIAIASATRAKIAPDLPTMIESGVPGYIVTQWHGMLAPRGTPQGVIERLYQEIAAAVKQLEVVKRLALDGTEGVASSPREFAAHLRNEREQWTKVVQLANIRAE